MRQKSKSRRGRSGRHRSWWDRSWRRPDAAGV